MDLGLAVVRPGASGREEAARTLLGALSGAGFALVEGPLVPVAAAQDLVDRGRRFFALPRETKARLAMARGGRAWRGWFPPGGELTSGRPDAKEGLYLGRELGPDHPAVRRGRPLHGQNLLPPEPGWDGAVADYLDALASLGFTLLDLIEVGLGLEPGALAGLFRPEPLLLLRLFRYPGVDPGEEADPAPGVGEHTDYGFLTLLYQDDRGGLEVRTPRGWRPVPPRPGTLVLNVGDMLERATGGRLRSTAHRVVRRGTEDRLTLPFFFDPNFDARVRPLFPGTPDPRPAERWDGEDPLAFEGTYGEYLVRKVTRVFPQLGEGLGGGPDGDSQSPGPRE